MCIRDSCLSVRSLQALNHCARPAPVKPHAASSRTSSEHWLASQRGQVQRQRRGRGRRLRRL
eukprot:6322337-Prymnesium_polylepis.1